MLAIHHLPPSNVPSISEVATIGSNLGKATNGSETRYAVLGDLGKPNLFHSALIPYYILFVSFLMNVSKTNTPTATDKILSPARIRGSSNGTSKIKTMKKLK